MLLLIMVIFLQVSKIATISPLIYRPNCYDYTVTSFDTHIYNDLGYTTAMTLQPFSSCEIEITTGIARFVYESGVQVQMFSMNSLGQPVKIGNVGNGQILYWYGFDGKAPTRKFVLNNPIQFPVSFRITVQNLKHMLDQASSLTASVALVGVAFLQLF